MSASHRGDGLGEGLVCASMRRTVAARLVQWPSRWPFIGPPRGPTMRSLQTSGSPPPGPGLSGGLERAGGRPGVRVGGGGGRRRAGHLVLALGAAFKPRHAMGYAPLQGLVVAGLEMQAIDPLERAP